VDAEGRGGQDRHRRGGDLRVIREALAQNPDFLVINGERDPVTPPDFGRRVTQAMTRVVRIEVPWGTHGGDDPCTDKIQQTFIEKGSGMGLDLSCVDKIQMTPFVLEPQKEKTAGE